MISRTDLAAFGAIALWATLASISSILGVIPPFFVTGVGLLIGSSISLFTAKGDLSKLRVPPKTLFVGVLGLFGFHSALFAALQLAPVVQANLVNYLWPLLMVVLAPLIIPGSSLRIKHVIAALVGFAGAGLAITSQGVVSGGSLLGYGFALASAFIWAGYSLLTKRLPHFESSAVGVFALVSGLLALLAHVLFEAPVSPTAGQWMLLVVLGLGPLGGAFYLWDFAIKTGDPQRIGLFSFLTPLLSTTLLIIVSNKDLTWTLLASGLMIMGSAFLGSRSSNG